jgi:LmbE family N-acetylglucosaminyl deacetylase
LFAHANIKRWTSLGGQQILIVAPHPDDEAIGCAGTALLHATSGDRVCIAIATDGRRSKVIPDPNAMSVQRFHEASHAARLMQVDRLEWIGLPEGEWCVSDLRHALQALLERLNPSVIYAPSRIDFHPEHFKVAHALALALEATDVPDRRIRVYQIQVPLTSLVCNLVADVSTLTHQCEAILRTYVTQAASTECSRRQRRYSARLYGVADQAEAFWEMPASQYTALHRAPPRDWPTVFRGLRDFPLTDPLAYLVGRTERRRMTALQHQASHTSAPGQGDRRTC